MPQAPYVAVVGPGDAPPPVERDAEEVGRLLAGEGAVVVCGGLGGVMAAACRGAKAAGGVTVAILPGDDRSDANPWVDVAVATGMGEGRNALLARTADAAVALAGGYGTLSEIALALRMGRPVVGLGSWDIDGLDPATSPADAVTRALAAVRRASS
jgi:uncharacterized protein (TIGR00725 family)